jgi:hypothetical protein
VELVESRDSLPDRGSIQTFDGPKVGVVTMLERAAVTRFLLLKLAADRV